MAAAYVSGSARVLANTSASQASSVAGVASQHGFPHGPPKVGGKRDRTSQEEVVPQSGSGLTGAEAGSPHARAGTTLALEIDVHVDGMREPVQGPTIRMDKKVREIKTSILRHLQKLEVLIVGPPHDIALRALWLPGDVPELNEEAEEVQIGRRKYSAVRLEVCAAPRNKW